MNKLTKTIGIYLLLFGVAVLMLFPLLWLIGTAFKSPTEDIFSFPPQLLPAQPTWHNFKTVWQTYPFGKFVDPFYL